MTKRPTTRTCKYCGGPASGWETFDGWGCCGRCLLRSVHANGSLRRLYGHRCGGPACTPDTFEPLTLTHGELPRRTLTGAR